MPGLASNQVPPSYCHHKQPRQAIVTLNGNDFLLGTFDSRDSRQEYNLLIAE